MSNIHVLKIAEELKASSQSLINKVEESRRKTHDALQDLRELEETVKTRLRDEHERVRQDDEFLAEDFAAPVVEPVAPVAAVEAAAPAPATQEPAPAVAAPAPVEAETPKTEEPAAAQKVAPVETPAKAKSAEPAPAAPEKPAAKATEAAKDEPVVERVYTPKQDDRPRQSYGRDDRFQPAPQFGRSEYTPRPQGNGTFQPRPQGNGTFQPRQQGNGTFQPRPQGNGTFQPRPQGNGTFQPRPQGNGTFQPRPQGNGTFQPRPQGNGTFQPRPQGNGTFQPRPGGPRPGGGGGYGQRPVTERDIKKQLQATPTMQKERVSNYDPNKMDQRRREKVAESQTEDKKNKNRKTLVTDIVPGAEMEDFYSPQGSYGRRPKKLKKPVRPERIIISEATVTGDRVTIKTLAERIGKPGAEIIKKLMLLGIIANINQDIDYETAALVAGEFGITLNQELEKSFEDRMFDDYGVQDDQEKLQTRPPIVTIMGHVDHGKTSLLDAIRQTKVAAGEAGGITQHIGAYSVELRGRQITFLDTPGHEAFTSMRARGAQATDIAILVVAANDGVMPQTIEAINHAKAAKVPIIVAINKIDLPGVDPDRIKQQLTEYELVAEEWGGETVMVPVSATTKQGLDTLLEMILLVADVQELKANPDSAARGIIVEARMDKGRGPVATVLIQNGTLHVGDYVVAGSVYGRVRAMNDDLGKRVDAATPAMPVELMGLSETPEAGDILYAVADEKLARQVADERRLKARSESLAGIAGAPMKLDDLFSRMAEGEVIDLNIIIRADVRGSAEAVKSSLEKLTNDKVRIKTLQSGVGSINENDIMLAAASNAIVIGFNVRPDSKASDAAERESVDVRTYRIIYQAIEDMEKAMKGLLKPEFKEVVNGHAEIRSLIRISSIGVVAGSYVTDGKMTRGSSVRLLRNGVVVYEGKLASLRRFKDDVREVERGYECGISLDNYSDVKEGDVIEAFAIEEIKAE